VLKRLVEKKNKKKTTTVPIKDIIFVALIVSLKPFSMLKKLFDIHLLMIVMCIGIYLYAFGFNFYEWPDFEVDFLFFLICLTLVVGALSLMAKFVGKEGGVIGGDDVLDNFKN
jgi:hypothetical protein